eukprot:354397-Chlamydomonas_euryale.AAC.4
MKTRRVVRAQNICRGHRSRPMTPAEAEAGPRTTACMHINTPRPEAEGHFRACMSEAEGLLRPRQA